MQNDDYIVNFVVGALLFFFVLIMEERLAIMMEEGEGKEWFLLLDSIEKGRGLQRHQQWRPLAVFIAATLQNVSGDIGVGSSCFTPAASMSSQDSSARGTEFEYKSLHHCGRTQ